MTLVKFRLQLRLYKSYFERTKMLKISRKVEYGIIALKYLHSQDSLCKSKEISKKFGIPPEVMAKILQGLAKAQFIQSIQGAKGGYKLVRCPAEISMKDVIEVIDGPIQIVDCVLGKDHCPQRGVCNIQGPLSNVQEKLCEFFGGITLVDLVR